MTTIDLDELRTGAEELGIALDATALERFALFARRLYEANERQNLTRVPEELFVQRHALESLHPLWALGESIQEPMVDVGTGAGFPGVPVTIVMPNAKMVLVDSHGKATSFLERVVEELGLEGVSVVWGRAEEVAHQPGHREQYGLALCRALGGFPIVAELLSGFVRVGGFAVPHRTAADGDVPPETIALLGLELERTSRHGDLRYPILKKSSSLESRYPRPWKQLRRAGGR